MKRILLTGKDGQIGWELQRSLAPLGEVVACDRQTLDLAQPDRIRTLVRDIKPAIIVHAAGYTAVDRAETDSANAHAINTLASGILGEEAQRLGALLVDFSTDYVFDGGKPSPYVEDDAPAPLNVYARTKFAGQQAILATGCRHLLLRVSWIYGLRGNNFLRTILRLAAERKELHVVDDQIGAPTWSRLIAEVVATMLARQDCPQGLFHLSCAGETSWHGFAQAILQQTQFLRTAEPALYRIPSRDYPLPAARPLNSRLSCRKLEDCMALKLPDWRIALQLCLAQLADDRQNSCVFGR